LGAAVSLVSGEPSRSLKSAVLAFSVAAAASTSPALSACSMRDGAPARFDLRAGEALDHNTGLIWRRCSEGLQWQEAGHCEGKKKLMPLSKAVKTAAEAGLGWRLPTVQELSSLAEPECGKPAINSRVFPDIGPDVDGGSPYWTSTPSPFEEMRYVVDLLDGYADIHSPGFAFAVRLVRDTPAK
jgi:hypothetical protein